MTRILFLPMIALSLCIAQNLVFFQNGYDVTLDIARCTEFNSSVYTYMKIEFVLYNRTTRTLNTTFVQLMDLGRDTIVHVQLYKFMSNEYRFFPVTVSFNQCVEFRKNAFGFADDLTKVSNVNPCDMKKGFTYISYFMPDVSRFPPHLPRGSYKLHWMSTYRSYHLYTAELYGKIKDKPVDWKNIPKRNWD